MTGVQTCALPISNFGGLVDFWLKMHLHFRQTLEQIAQDTDAAIAANLARETWGSRLARTGGQFVQHLHGHHGIEDQHYFPILAARDTRLANGFEILDRDHEALTGLLGGFVGDANSALRAIGQGDFVGEAARFRETLARLERFLDRHLTDEEELIVPVILRDGEAGLT